VPAAKKIVVALLKRIDTVVAAVLVGFCAAPVAQAWLCADISCRSSFDTALYYAVAAMGALGAGLVLWRYTRRWWSRVLVVPAALYAVLVGPPAILAHGRWTVMLAAGRPCPVRAGMTTADVHVGCGDPGFRCEGPKFIQSESAWNPFSILVCGFHGDVYGDRLVTYDCRGRVASVETISAGPREYIPGCVTRL
jgi:hypothetical protein